MRSLPQLLQWLGSSPWQIASFESDTKLESWANFAGRCYAGKTQVSVSLLGKIKLGLKEWRVHFQRVFYISSLIGEMDRWKAKVTGWSRNQRYLHEARLALGFYQPGRFRRCPNANPSWQMFIYLLHSTRSGFYGERDVWMSGLRRWSICATYSVVEGTASEGRQGPARAHSRVKIKGMIRGNFCGRLAFWN